MPHDMQNALKPSEDEMVAIRRDIHKHPETAFEEVRTSDIVAAKLDVQFAETIPDTATGRILKTTLRQVFKSSKPPMA